MGNSQERNEEADAGAHAPEQPAPRGRSGEGAASAMQQVMSENAQQRQPGRSVDDGVEHGQ
jgi:hypothetical protein